MIKSRNARIADWIIALFCFILILACLLPLINILSRSLSSPDALVRNEVAFLPKGLTLDAYHKVLIDATFIRSMIWTAILTIICVFISMFMTTVCSYPLIYDNLKGRNFFNSMFLLTMYFGAGTIPTYLMLSKLHMLNSPTVLIFPWCLSVFNVIIMRSFLYGIPDSLRESAEIDGAGPVRILVSIYLPLSTSVIATLSLFYGVGRWNGFSDALMFMISNKKYYPIQLLLFRLIRGDENFSTMETVGRELGATEPLKAASIMFATVPILLVYPWLQRYFISGVTLGAVKG